MIGSLDVFYSLIFLGAFLIVYSYVYFCETQIYHLDIHFIKKIQCSRELVEARIDGKWL
jgi:hypothetical protein